MHKAVYMTNRLSYPFSSYLVFFDTFLLCAYLFGFQLWNTDKWNWVENSGKILLIKQVEQIERSYQDPVSFQECQLSRNQIFGFFTATFQPIFQVLRTGTEIMQKGLKGYPPGCWHYFQKTEMKRSQDKLLNFSSHFFKLFHLLY